MKTENQLSLAQTLKSGLIAALITAIIANICLGLLQSMTNSYYEEINHFSVTIALILPNVIGSFLFYQIFKKTNKPVLFYSLFALIIVLLDSLIVHLNPSLKEGIEHIADHLHFIVGFCSVLFIVLLIRKELNTSSNK